MVSQEYLTCVPKQLDDGLLLASAETAVRINAANAPRLHASNAVLMSLTGGLAPILSPAHLALLTGKYWGSDGVKLTVGFMEPCPVDLRNRILSHMNAWSEYANVSFVWTPTEPQVRITRDGEGYWSYLGTDILHIPRNQPTMSLQGFTMSTPESEYKRVVRHETGHTLGFPHEHQLAEIVALLDPQKTIAWGEIALGWSATMIQQQILTPIPPGSVRMTPHADLRGIMCYQLPASITKSGQPIPGGTDIDDVDAQFVATLYPKPNVPPPPPPPPTDTHTIFVKGGTVTVDGKEL